MLSNSDKKRASIRLLHKREKHAGQNIPGPGPGLVGLVVLVVLVLLNHSRADLLLLLQLCKFVFEQRRVNTTRMHITWLKSGMLPAFLWGCYLHGITAMSEGNYSQKVCSALAAEASIRLLPSKQGRDWSSARSKSVRLRDDSRRWLSDVDFKVKV